MYVETINLAWIRTKNRDLLLRLDEILLVSGYFRMIFTTARQLATARACLRKYEIPLSIVDWTTVVLMRERRFEYLLSFDDDFNRLKAIDEFAFLNRIGSAQQLRAIL